VSTKLKAVEQFTRWMFTDVLAALARSLKEDELSVAQVALLHLVDRAPASSKELSDRLGVAAPAMSRLVDDLVVRGFLTRTEADHDRRVRTLALTPAGRRFVDKVSEARVQQMLATIEAVPQALRDAVMTAMQAFDFTRRGGKP
jgi:DNA-binding MarR family transcriptional regulator